MSAFRLAVLVSGSGTNLQALIDAQQAGDLHAEIALVLSDRADAYGLQRALEREIPAAFVPLPRPPGRAAARAARAAWEQRLLAVIRPFTPDLIVLAGFMRVLSADFLAGAPAPVINQHPALLPESGDTVTTSGGLVIPALRGLHVVGEALRQGLPVTGCTIHRVTPAVDDGPVLARAEVPVLPDDDEASLHERIKAAERRLIVEVVRQLAAEQP
ncbi:MAG TPA: phosphoribosylglycinamide formyltransferase [Roseiflexaceae bacterium]|nr:phosphoribosylglycinamide formyltransferase [Roseiflexaceae bacterium]